MGLIVVSFVAIFCATLAVTTGVGLLGTLLGLRMTLEGYSSQVIGMVMGGYYLGLVVGGVGCGSVVARVGHIRAFAVFAALSTAFSLMHGLCMGPWSWWGLRVLTGIAMMGLYMVLESWLCECSSPSIRGRVFALYMACSFFGLGAGQLLLNVAPLDQPTLFFVVALFLVLSLLPVALTRAMSPQMTVTRPFRLGQLAKVAPFGVLGCFMSGVANGSFFALAPSFAMQLGVDRAGIALFMGLAIFSGLVSQWPIGLYSDHHDRRGLLALLCLALAFACGLVVAAVGQPFCFLLLASVLFGGLASSLYPVAVAHTHDHVSPDDVVSVSVLLLLLYGVGAMLGPIAASQIMGYLGPEGLYGFVGLCSALMGGMAFIRRHAETVAVQRQEPYIAVPRTSPVIQELDPRAEEALPPASETGSPGVTEK